MIALASSLGLFLPQLLFGVPLAAIFVLLLAYFVVMACVANEKAIVGAITVVITGALVLLISGVVFDKALFIDNWLTATYWIVGSIVIGLIWAGIRYRRLSKQKGREYFVWLRTWAAEKAVEGRTLEEMNLTDDQRISWDRYIASKMNSRDYIDMYGKQKGPNFKTYKWAISCWIMFWWADAPYYLLSDFINDLVHKLRHVYHKIGSSGFESGAREAEKDLGSV